jgi:hypothetical protein
MAGIEQIEVHSKVGRRVRDGQPVIPKWMPANALRITIVLHRPMGEGRRRAHGILECPASQKVDVSLALR